MPINATNKKTRSKIDIYDVNTLRRLYKDYGVSYQKLADVLGVTRQNISDKLNGKGKSKDDAWLIPFTEAEEEKICQAIEKGKEENLSDDFSFMLVRAQLDPFSKAIMMRNNRTVKVAFELSGRIGEALKKQGLDIWTVDDIKAIKELEELWRAQGSTLRDGKKQVFLDAAQKDKIKSLAKKLGIKYTEYLEMNGFSYDDKRKYSREEIIERIKKYADKNNCVEIDEKSSKNDDYQFFVRMAHNNHQTIYEFFEYYGFYYPRNRKTIDIEKKHKNIIEERYKVDGNRIYIPSYDMYYRTLKGLALRRKITMDELLEKWGYVRILHKRDLPTGYTPYDSDKCVSSMSSSEMLDDCRIENALSIACNDSKEVYLDESSYLYYIVYLKAKTLGMSMDDVVARFGYKRIFVAELSNDAVQRYDEADSIFESTIKQLISRGKEELRQLQSQFRVTESQQKSIGRNKQLVAKLKELYQGKCQLCDPQAPIPLICKENGELYSEVHHVVSIHTAGSDEEIEYIDSYKNTIVLCPHHHKYVHYHHGGFRKIVLDDDVLYLENEIGERIRIHTDYHLKDDEGDGQ